MLASVMLHYDVKKWVFCKRTLQFTSGLTSFLTSALLPALSLSMAHPAAPILLAHWYFGELSLKQILLFSLFLWTMAVTEHSRS